MSSFVRTFLRLSAAVLLALSLTGCIGQGKSGESSKGVDPQVLQDVIDSTFTLPGKPARRMMRVIAFTTNVARSECGAVTVPLDETIDRFNEFQFPVLSLIRKDGLEDVRDTYARDNRLRSSGECKDFLPDGIPSYQAWQELAGSWADTAIGLLGSAAALEPLKSSTADCLRRRTGLSVSNANPIKTFEIAATRIDDLAGPTAKRWSRDFADCTEKFYAAFTRVLRAKREPLIERNREFLERFASELVANGYTP